SYHGYPMAFGVATWRGLGIAFTDGMCPRCAVHFRQQWKLAPPGTATVPRGGPLRSAAALLVVTGLILAVRPFDRPRAPSTMTPHPETRLVPAPIEVQSPAPVDPPRAPRPPRRARTAAPRMMAAKAPAAVSPEPPVVVAEAALETAAMSTAAIEPEGPADP